MAKGDEDRLPPHNIEAEESVLGAMMLDSNALTVAVETLRPDDFYRDQHRVLFKALHELGQEGLPGDLVLAADRLNEKGTLDAAGGKAYIHTLVDTTPNPNNVVHYVTLVKELARRRRAIEASYLIINAAHAGESYDTYLEAFGEASDNNHPQLKTVTAYDLQRMTFPPPTFIVKNLLPAGLTFFAGAYKTGKSYMVLGLGVSVAKGGVFLGEPTTQGEVLFVGVEDNERRLHSRLSSLCLEGWPDSLHIATRFPRLDDGGLEALENFIMANPETRLVVLDVWARIRGRERSRNAYMDDYSALEGLQAFAGDHDVSVVAVHHHRKAPDIDPFNRFSGSTAIGGGADALWSLERERGECNASFIITGRDVHDISLALDFNEETGEWTALGPLNEYQTSTARLQIIQLLRETEGSLSPKDISEALDDKKPSTVRSLLAKMVVSGEVEKVSRGEYQLRENVTYADFSKDGKETPY